MTFCRHLQQLPFYTSGFNICSTCLQSKKKSGTGCIKIKTESIFYPDLIGNDICSCRERHIRSSSGTDQEIDIFRRCSCFFKQPFTAFSPKSERTKSFTFKNSSLLYSYPLHNPFIRSINHFGKFMIVNLYSGTQALIPVIAARIFPIIRLLL